MRHRLTAIAFLLVLASVPAASAQDITAWFYPEKQEYVVGEPIVIVLEVKNATSHEVEMEDSSCDGDRSNHFQVTNAPILHDASLFGCVPPGSDFYDCLIGAEQVPARGILRKRYLLNGPDETQFDIASAGTYHIKTSKEARIDGKGGFGDLVADVHVENEFDILIREPADGELQSLSAPYEKDLNSRAFETQELAAHALTQNPPEFLEPVILSMADSRDDALRFAAIDGLKKLATPAARAKLIELASDSSSVQEEGVAQQAIEALGEIANPDDCSSILRIASHAKGYTGAEAFIAAGWICRVGAIPTLVNFLRTADWYQAAGVAAALGNTGSRKAIPPLIDLLASPDESVRIEADSALFTLTHRGIQDVSTPAAAAQVQSAWRGWWLMNSDSAPVYRPNQCPATIPTLPMSEWLFKYF
jgi:HEAT repeat protein